MRMAVKTPLRVTVGGVVPGQVPDDQGLVARAGEQHVGAGKRSVCNPRREQDVSLLLQRGRERGNPAIVAFKGPALNQLDSHGVRRESQGSRVKTGERFVD